MALSINLSTFIDAGYTGDVIRWILKEAVSGVEIDRHEEPGPHGVVYNFSFANNIRDIVYRIELYDVPPAATIGNLIKAHDVTVSTSTILVNDDIEIIVGRGTPVDPNDTDTESPVIDDIIGIKGNLLKRTAGQLLKVREPEWDKDYAFANGILRLNDGATYDNGDVYIFKPDIQLVINPPGSQGTGGFVGVEIITNNRSVDSTDAGKLFIIEQTAKVLTIKMPSYLTFPEDIPLYFQNTASNSIAINAVVQTSGGDTIIQNGFNDGNFIFSRGESGYIIRKGNQFYGVNNSPDARYRGRVELCNYTFMNREYADGREVNADDYPGVDQALQRMPAGTVLTSFAAWNLSIDENIYTNEDNNGIKTGSGIRTVFYNRGYFARYQVSGVWKIRFPDYRKKFIRPIDTSLTNDTDRRENKPGSWQSSTFVKHHIVVRHGGVGGVDSNPNGGGWGYASPTQFGDPTDKVFGGGGPYVTGTETRPDNIGNIACVII